MLEAEGTSFAGESAMGRGAMLRFGVAAALAATAEYLGCTDPSGPAPDTDGDGLTDAEELNLYGTSPILADTDGDGRNDFEEAVTLAFDPDSDPYRFNPRVADVPQMAVAIVGPPVVTVQTTDSNGTVHTLEASRSDTVTTSVTDSRSQTNARSDSFSFTNTATAERSLTLPLPPPRIFPEDAGDGEAAAEPDDDEQTGSITLTDSVSTSVNPSTTFLTSVQFSEDQMRENAQTATYTESYAQSHDVTAIAGLLKLATVIRNDSHVAFRVTNVILAAAFIDQSGAVVPIQNLVIDQGLVTSFQPFSLGPGEATGILTFTSIPLTLDTTDMLLGNARALQVRLATYEIDDANNKSLAFSAEEVDAKTATVVIDYGPVRPPDIFQVATDLDPSSPGVTAAKALREILRIPYVEDGAGAVASVRAIGADAGAAWRVAHVHRDGSTDAGDAGDFDATVLRAGDVLHLAFVPGELPPSGPPPLGVGPPPMDAGLEVKPP
jgi:hypothetical protein